MVKRYVRFRAVGTGDDVGMVTVEGLCDALTDPMAVAMARSVELRRCQRVRLRTEPAFEVLCSGQRERRLGDISRQAREDWRVKMDRLRREREVAYWRQQSMMRKMMTTTARPESEMPWQDEYEALNKGKKELEKAMDFFRGSPTFEMNRIGPVQRVGRGFEIRVEGRVQRDDAE